MLSVVCRAVQGSSAVRECVLACGDNCRVCVYDSMFVIVFGEDCLWLELVIIPAVFKIFILLNFDWRSCVCAEIG